MTKLLTMYRVSSVYDGMGPYNTDDPNARRWMTDCGDAGNHPPMEQDGITALPNGHRFACHNKASFRLWWKLQWRRKWAHAFFLEVITIAPQYAELGYTHVAYDPEHVVSSRKLPLAFPLWRV